MSSSLKRIAADLVAAFAIFLILILVVSLFDLKRQSGGILFYLVVTLTAISICVIGLISGIGVFKGWRYSRVFASLFLGSVVFVTVYGSYKKFMNPLSTGVSVYDVATVLGSVVLFALLFNEEILEFMTRK